MLISAFIYINVFENLLLFALNIRSINLIFFLRKIKNILLNFSKTFQQTVQICQYKICQFTKNKIFIFNNKTFYSK